MEPKVTSLELQSNSQAVTITKLETYGTSLENKITELKTQNTALDTNLKALDNPMKKKVENIPEFVVIIQNMGSAFGWMIVLYQIINFFVSSF